MILRLLTRHALIPLAITVFLAAAGAEAVAPKTGELENAGTARVVEVIDGDTVRIDDGTEIRLVGIQAPKLPLGRRNFVAWPLAEEAHSALSGLAMDRTVTISYGGARVDRHDRRLAHLHAATPDGEVWLQGEMLRRGMARVYTFPDNRALADEMLRIEAQARTARRGIWNHPFYAVLGPEQAERHLDSFQLIEGTVLSADIARGRGYLNFGADWKTDFTISLAPDAVRLFRKSGIDIAALDGQRVRIRGWLGVRNGPVIEATHPEQLERLAK